MVTWLEVAQMQEGSEVALPRNRAIVSSSKMRLHLSGSESGMLARFVGRASKSTWMADPVSSIRAYNMAEGASAAIGVGSDGGDDESGPSSGEWVGGEGGDEELLAYKPIATW